MEMTAVVNQMLVMLILLLLGVLCARIGLIDAAMNKKLSVLVMNVTQSAMILGSAMSLESEVGAKRVLAVLGIAFLALLIVYGLSFVYTFLLRVKRPERGTWQFLATLGNFGFMGFPVVSALLGAQALFYNSLFLIPGMLFTYTVGVVMIRGGGRGELRLRSLLSPPLLASVLAAVIVLLRVRFPAFLVTAASTLGAMTTPGAMLVVGASLGMMSLKDVLGDWKMYVYALVRLLTGPVIVWLVLRLFVSDPLILRVAVLLVAMPSAMNTTMMALQYGGNEKVASRGVFLSTIFSFITIPLLVWLLL